MDEEVGIKNERVDDIPLLLAQMERMGIYALSSGSIGAIAVANTSGLRSMKRQQMK